jgi:hypothetical protein
MQDLLIYTVVADTCERCSFSALWDEDEKRYTMPHLSIKIEEKEIFYCDNDEWITDSLLPALQAFKDREMTIEHKDVLKEITDLFPGKVPEQLEVVSDLLQILNYAIKHKML